MKKLLALTLCAALLLGTLLLTACGDTDEAPDGYQYASDNDACKYKMLVPSAWHVKQDSESDFSSATIGTADTCNVSVANLTFFAEDMGAYWSQQVPTYQAIFGNSFKVVSEGTDKDGNAVEWELVDIAETKGYRYIFTASFNGKDYKVMQIYFGDFSLLSTDVYCLTYTATADHYDTHLEDIQNVIKMLKFDN